MAEGETEYESDPEEAKLSLKLRRRVASDDEEECEEGGSRQGKPPRRADESDVESEGGAAAGYEDELMGAGGGYDLNEEYSDEEVVEYEESGGGDDLEVVAVERVEGGGEESVGDVTEELMKEKKDVNSDVSEIDAENGNVADGQREKERKEIEPFAVPTEGAFYMHDDRFRDNAGGRNRRTLGGRKLWESKDDRKWGHDKFEELTMQESHHEEHRRGARGRGRGRGRGRSRGAARGYFQQNRPREYVDNSITQHYDNNNNNNNQSHTSKSVRGRGPRRYQPFLNNQEPVTQNKTLGKSVEKEPNASSGRVSHPVSNTESVVAPPQKQVTSNLNVASPPFYPTGSSLKDSTVTHKKDFQDSTVNRNGIQASMDVRSNIMQATGKNTVDFIAGLGELNIDDTASAMAGKSSNTKQVPSSVKPTQPQLKGQGTARNSLRQMAYQPAVLSNEINGIPSSSQLQSVQGNSGQNHALSSGQAYAQQFTQHLPRGPQACSPSKASEASKHGEMDFMSVSSEMKTTVVDKGQGGMQGSGRGSLLHQVMGASSGPAFFQPQLKGQGTALNLLRQMAYQPAVLSNEINRIPSPSQLQSVQGNSGQNHALSSGQAYSQQFTQHLPRGPQACSPPKASEASKHGEMDSMSISSEMKTAVVDKGQGGMQGSGRGSLLHQVMGASSGPAFFQVMQFGGQHPGGIGVPALGMAYPGYVGQPQGGSEMTWLPVLTGAAGALGSTYCPPYITVDGSFNTQPSRTAPSTETTSSKETSTMKVGNEWKPAQRPELVTHDFGQKQKNPRRYTEMKFDQRSN